jgi:predicted RNA-binding protein with PIN domain
MPYFGKKARELRKRVEEDGLTISSRKVEKLENNKETKFAESGLDGAFRRGYITEDEFRDVYTENLETVLEYVKKLINNLEGKTVVTSDHGEYLGEYNKAGHYEYEYTEELRKVPWLVVNDDQRPKIIEEEPSEKNTIDQSAIERRLEHLGYK